MDIKILIVLNCFTVAVLSNPFSITDCGDENSYLHLNSISVTPSEFEIPGAIKISTNVTVDKDFQGAQLDLKIKIKTKFIWWITIPCVSNIGSCTYDLCPLLKKINKKCPKGLTSNGIPCSCGDLEAGIYSLDNQKFDISLPLDGLWSWLASGDYKLDITMTDRVTQKQVGCLKSRITIK